MVFFLLASFQFSVLTILQLDISAIDWVINWDPPDDPRDYIHRGE